MWPDSINKTDQESENTSDLAAPEASNNGKPAPAALKEEPPLTTNQHWNSATEEEWNEHSATAWALAYVIHRIRSTPHPPILLPEQRRHFEKITEMAAALIEEWQRRERDLAQQLAQERPVPELSPEVVGTGQDNFDDSTSAPDLNKQLYARPYYLILDDAEEAASDDPQKGPETPAADQDYQI